MSQYDFGVIDPAATSGTQLLDHLGLTRDAVNSMHKGAARPSYAKAGMLWVKSATKPLLMYYDGTSDTTLGEIDLAAGVIKVGNSTKFNGRLEADFLLKSGNLSGLIDKAAARSNLGLGIGSAVQAFSSVLTATTASFTTALKSKLDNIAAGAQVNPTNAATKTAYEANSDTNAFTDGHKTKLDTLISAIASQVEAEAGTDNSKRMTPLRVKQAIAGQAASSRVLLATTAISLDQFADFVFPAETYSYYELVFKALTHDYTPVTGRNLGLRVSTDGGVTYLTTGYSSVATTAYFDGVALTASQLYIGYCNNVDGATGRVVLIPDANGMAIMVDAVSYNSLYANRVVPTLYKAMFKGAAVNAIRVGVDSTSYNLNTGTIEFYGVK
jgi:hypothetical protein